MNKKLYLSLAAGNIRKNRTAFFPFAVSSVTMIALFYMICAIQSQVSQSDGFYGMGSIEIILRMGVGICGIFAAGVIFYTNGFLMKQRSKELGLYRILGMERRHIAKVLFWELLLLGTFCIGAGLGFGILFSRLMFLLLLKMMRIDAAIPFGIATDVVLRTALLFGAVFAAGMIRNAILLVRVRPIDLLKAESCGEREPKAKWLQAILAVLCLGAGYTIAVTTENPLKAISLFFSAALLVMAGTYLLFMSASIALLKLLKKNKRYYFHRTHFITISGMMYRMKRNAAGLANICILSTAVLLVISTTVSLYAGVDDSIESQYLREVQTSYLCLTKTQRSEQVKDVGSEPEEALDDDLVERTVAAHAKAHGVRVSNVFRKYCMFLIAEEQKQNEFADLKQGENVLDNAVFIGVISQDAYNDSVNEAYRLKELPDKEAFIWDSRKQLLDGDSLTLYGETITARTLPEALMSEKAMKVNLDSEFGPMEDGYRCILIVAPDRTELERLTDQINAYDSNGTNERNVTTQYEYQFDIDGAKEDETRFLNTLRDALNRAGIPHVAQVGNKFSDRAYYEGLYASIFFIGIFIGTMFLLATVLIIYYKQVSEGFEDRSRFEILQKVGMDRQEVKRVITTQILQVFFLPLLLSCVHMGFAFFIVKRILAIMGLMNVGLFVGCTVISVLVFAAVYGIVYYLTAGVYYRIVYGGDF